MSAYLDHAAGSPLRPAAAEALAEALATVGNPSSIHGHGQRARRLLEESRERLAAALDCDPREVVFTSGGTESVGTAIKGAYWAAHDRPDHDRRTIVAPGGEHAATVDAIDWLVAHEGAALEPVQVDAEARLDPLALAAALDRVGAGAALVTFLWANNEVGTINPVARLTAEARAHGVPVHVDAVAAFGAVPVSFAGSGADLLSVSSHKVGGPAGIGALLVARSAHIEPLLHGGGQERALRSGTQPVALAAAFAVAAEQAVHDLAAESGRLAALRDDVLAGLTARLPGVVVRGADPAGPDRLPGNLHVTVPGADGDALLLLLDLAGVSVSTGAACQAGVAEPSHVLAAMGVPVPEARGALRITLGHTSSASDLDALIAALPRLAAAIA
ncbi:cysteine desulfurase family protein [uncultured Amnibacterium sp.]|uniref:cysteine desulfurase family protein n=1 Tax=uncultured Amnibacterium sp. TaxID=1631851 RepID=UPI0035CC817B